MLSPWNHEISSFSKSSSDLDPFNNKSVNFTPQQLRVINNYRVFASFYYHLMYIHKSNSYLKLPDLSNRLKKQVHNSANQRNNNASIVDKITPYNYNDDNDLNSIANVNNTDTESMIAGLRISPTAGSPFNENSVKLTSDSTIISKPNTSILNRLGQFFDQFFVKNSKKRSVNEELTTDIANTNQNGLIIETSLRNDDHDGDSNQNGDTASPTKQLLSIIKAPSTRLNLNFLFSKNNKNYIENLLFVGRSPFDAMNDIIQTYLYPLPDCVTQNPCMNPFLNQYSELLDNWMDSLTEYIIKHKIIKDYYQQLNDRNDTK